jgi:lipopolysaccharide biosynthesis regulator YciM
MFEAAALVLEEISPEDKTRTQVLRARVVLYMAAKKWDMAATIASHLVKVEPENETLEGATALLIARNCRSLFSVILSADALAPKFRNRN